MCELRHAQCYWSLLCYFILFIRPMCSRIFKKNVCIMVQFWNIYVDIFLIDPIFILQIICFCTGCLSKWYEIWIQATYFSRRPRCKRIQIVNFKSDETRAKKNFSKAHSAATLGHCAEFVDVAKILWKWCQYVSAPNRKARPVKKTGKWNHLLRIVGAGVSSFWVSKEQSGKQWRSAILAKLKIPRAKRLGLVVGRGLN